jgi:capsular polysaccharide biosynthesis protein
MCLALYMTHNYYHWLIDNLPKVLLTEEAGFTGTYLVPPLPYARQSLELLGISGSRIVEHNIEDFWRAERLFISKPLDYELQFARPHLLARLRAALLAALPKPGLGGRLYVSRNRKGVARDIINEAELKALLGRFGFTEFFCEDHPVAAQLAAFAGAGAAIGSEGAGFANALVMPKGALLLALSSPLRTYCSIAALVPARLNAIRYYTVFAQTPLPFDHAYDGGYPYGDRVVADLEMIKTTLERELK